jgi:hypothetical protein
VATTNKDFRVKNGLQVTESGTFGGTVSVATPTSSNHATTKDYVDSIPTGYTVSETPPENPIEGDGWYKSSTSQTFVFYDSFWVESGSSMAGPTGPTGPGISNVESPLYYDSQYQNLSIDLSAYATETYVDVAVAQIDVTDQLQEVQIATIMGAY